MPRRSAREAAMRLFYQKDVSGSHNCDMDALTEMVKEFVLNDKDLVYIRTLLEKAENNRSEIDRYISLYSKDWSFDRLAKVDLAILRVAVCEMLFFSDIPRNVSINEAVDLAKKYGDSGSGAFVNGVLGGIYDELEQLRR